MRCFASARHGWIALWIAILGIGPTAQAITLQVPLSLAPPSASGNQMDIGVSADVLFAGTLSDTASSNLSGSATAELELDVLSQGAIVTGIRFLAGSVQASDVSLSLSVLTANSSGLAGTLSTPGIGFSTVALDGTFPAADHQLTINQGSVNYPGGSENFSAMPLTVPGEAGQSGSLNAQEIGGTATTVDYGLTVFLPASVTESIPVENALLANNAVDFSLAGTLMMVGQFTVELPAPGDFNLDGSVDSADYATWRNLFAAGQAPAANLDLWRQNFGQTSAAALNGATLAAVPEPSSPVLVAIWMLASVRHRYRQR